jgi:hypothetical protein
VRVAATVSIWCVIDIDIGGDLPLLATDHAVECIRMRVTVCHFSNLVIGICYRFSGRLSGVIVIFFICMCVFIFAFERQRHVVSVVGVHTMAKDGQSSRNQRASGFILTFPFQNDCGSLQSFPVQYRHRRHW